MQLVPDGPNIPLEILDAQEEGELALFVGAGVSVPNGLPLFGGLVDNVRQELGASWEPEEKEAYDDYQYDRVLGLLEREHRYPDQVRPTIQDELKIPDNPDLDTHNALIDLARDEYGTGDLHLVTTNFDRLFEETSKDYKIASAPRVPVPKQKKWDELVYLHGYIGDHDPDGRHLVLSSGDFGNAYLAERWASRFVSELFNHFTVLFVGYSVNDPVMRYLVDAIAADREQGIDERLQEAYAFASYGDRSREEVEEEWRTKNINPIPYPEDKNHQVLHDTLREWAQLWRGGLKSKKNLVTTHGTKSPETLTEEISQVQWAMLDSPAAREFADLKRKAPLDWLSEFEDLPEFDEMGLTNYEVSEERLQTNIPLVDGGANTATPQSLSKVTSAVANWLTAHLNKPDLVHWVLRNGGHLHPEFRRKIQSKLADGGPPQPYRALWQVLAGSEPFVCRPITSTSLGDRLSSEESPEEWNPGLRGDLLSALTPCLQLQPRGSHFPPLSLQGIGDEEEEGQTDPSKLSDLARMNLGIQSHFPRLIVDRLEDRSDYEEVLQEIAFDLVRLLQEAMELFELFGRAGKTEDAIHRQRPSISSHDQNSDREWTILIDLLREAVRSLAGERRSEARALTWLFAAQEYPLFRRFALFSYKEFSLPEPGFLLRHLTESPTAWLWATSIQVELFRALPMLWDALDTEDRTRLADTIVEGPPRSKYREGISDDEWTRLRDRAVWNRLVRIRHISEHDLTESALDRLEEIEEQFPEWEYMGEEQEDFPFWTEVGWGYETDYPAESLLDRDDEEIVDILLNHERHRQGLIESWREAVKLEPSRANEILETLHEHGGHREDVWKSSVRGFRDVEVQEELHADFLVLIGRLPNDFVEALTNPLSSLLETISEAELEGLEEVLLALWDRLWPTAVEYEVRDDSDPLNAAINHPAGKLAELLFHLLRKRELVKDGGIDADLHSRIEAILDTNGDGARLARTIVASRLARLYFLEPDWTEKRVVRLFDWTSSDEARFAWSGYLWSPTMRPDLWPSMKPYFLSTFEHLDQLREEAHKSLAVLLVAIAVEGDQTLSDEEARHSLRQLDEQGRTEVARWIVRRLEGAGERGEVLWAERIGPWVETAWPQEAELRSSQTSVSLAWAAIEAGDAFPEAVDIIDSRVTTLDRPASILGRLAESRHPSSHPESSLQLLDILIDDISFPHTAEELDQCLDDISASEPSLAEDPRYIRLLELVEQYL